MIKKIIGLTMALASVVFLTFLLVVFFLYPNSTIELYEPKRIISGFEIILGIIATLTISKLLLSEIGKIRKKICFSIEKR